MATVKYITTGEIFECTKAVRCTKGCYVKLYNEDTCIACFNKIETDAGVSISNLFELNGITWTDESEGFAAGTNAATDNGGAVGNSAISSTGGAVGNNAVAESGGAIGNYAYTKDGGAVGNGALSSTGGAIGESAISASGGAVGEGSEATTGFAGGKDAKATADGAVQLGTGINEEANTLQFQNTQIVNKDGKIISDNLTTVPITQGGTGATDAEGALEKLGILTIGGGVNLGTDAFVDNMYPVFSRGGAVGYGARTGNGGAVGNGAQAGLGGAVGNGAFVGTKDSNGNTESLGSGGAVGQGASTSSGGAVGYDAEAGSGGAVGDTTFTETGGAVGQGAISGSGGAVGQNAFVGVRDEYGNVESIETGGAVGYNAQSTTGGAVGTESSTTTGGAVGSNAKTETGGAVGQGARSTTGFAGGHGAKTTADGAAVGHSSQSGSGGAVGRNAETDSGGAVGYNAQSTTGGAVGDGAISTIGFAGGKGANSENGGGAVGNGASTDSGGAVGNGASADRGGGAVGEGASTNYGGAAVGYNASSTNGGAAVGYNASSTAYGAAVGRDASSSSGGAVGQSASAEAGGAVGNGAKSGSGGAVGYNASSTNGGAVGQSASATTGFAGGYGAKAMKDGAVQLGNGTNNEANTLQFRNTQIVNKDGKIVSDNLDMKPIAFKRKLTSNDDLNNITEPGIYFYQTTDDDSGESGIPKNCPFKNAGIVEVIGTNDPSIRTIQRITRYGDPGYKAERILNHLGTWYDWRSSTEIGPGAKSIAFFDTIETYDISNINLSFSDKTLKMNFVSDEKFDIIDVEVVYTDGSTENKGTISHSYIKTEENGVRKYIHYIENHRISGKFSSNIKSVNFEIRRIKYGIGGAVGQGAFAGKGFSGGYNAKTSHKIKVYDIFEYPNEVYNVSLTNSQLSFVIKTKTKYDFDDSSGYCEIMFDDCEFDLYLLYETADETNNVNIIRTYVNGLYNYKITLSALTDYTSKNIKTISIGHFLECGSGDVAIGYQASADTRANAIGENAKANIMGVSIGTDSKSVMSLAVGCQADAGYSSVAVGPFARATPWTDGSSLTDENIQYAGIAIGPSADAAAIESAQIGTGTNSNPHTLQFINHKISDGESNLYGTVNALGADTAEQLEWLDGNINNEDRRGYFVTVENDKLRYATSSDDYILGVVSSKDISAFIANTAYDNWHDKYLRDVYGEYILEEKVIPEYIDEIGFKHPEKTVMVRILNPDFDEAREYIPRLNRPEWAVVCFMGQIVVNDDGTCKVNEYCKVSDNGGATAAEKTDLIKYRVIKRIDDSHVKIIFK